MAALQTKLNFMLSKGRNFKAYLMGFAPNAEAQALLDGFEEKEIMATIMTRLVPLSVLCQMDKAVDAIMECLTVPANQVAEVRAKVLAYLTMFVTVSISSVSP